MLVDNDAAGRHRTTMTFTQHPQRALLHNVIHARPPEALAAPLAISHIVMLADEAGRHASRAHLAELLDYARLRPPASASLQASLL